MASRTFNLHLVSDSTGETILSVARACVVQFAEFEAKKYLWPMVRNRANLEEALASIEALPGPVLFTLVDEDLRARLVGECARIGVPCIALLDQVMATLGSFLGAERGHTPGRQHEMDAEYFGRIDAMQFMLAHDDGAGVQALDEADVVLVGVSRSSKTPTSLYLANRGVKAANVPVIPEMPPPENLLACTRPLIVGLTTDPQRLVQIRRNRLSALNQDGCSAYVDLEAVTAEVQAAKRLCAQHGWPLLDVTRRSIEETAAAVLQLMKRRQANRATAAE